jgi:hypothetical protein
MKEAASVGRPSRLQFRSLSMDDQVIQLGAGVAQTFHHCCFLFGLCEDHSTRAVYAWPHSSSSAFSADKQPVIVSSRSNYVFALRKSSDNSVLCTAGYIRGHVQTKESQSLKILWKTQPPKFAVENPPHLQTVPASKHRSLHIGLRASHGYCL